MQVCLALRPSAAGCWLSEKVLLLFGLSVTYSHTGSKVPKLAHGMDEIELTNSCYSTRVLKDLMSCHELLNRCEKVEHSNEFEEEAGNMYEKRATCFPIPLDFS